MHPCPLRGLEICLDVASPLQEWAGQGVCAVLVTLTPQDTCLRVGFYSHTGCRFIILCVGVKSSQMLQLSPLICLAGRLVGGGGGDGVGRGGG